MSKIKTYTQAVNNFRTIRADLDRLQRLANSPRISNEFKRHITLELAAIAGLCEDARQFAISMKSSDKPREVSKARPFKSTDPYWPRWAGSHESNSNTRWFFKEEDAQHYIDTGELRGVDV